MPTNWTGRDAYSFDRASSEGCSRRQGPHQEPQKFTTPTFPARIADEIGWLPRREVAPNEGAGFGIAGGMLITSMPLATPIAPEPARPVDPTRSAPRTVPQVVRLIT